MSDRRVLKLVRKWLTAEVMEDGVTSQTVSGTPQGGVISPLLANIYLHRLDAAWAWTLTAMPDGVRLADARARCPAASLADAVAWAGRGLARIHGAPLVDEDRAHQWGRFSGLVEDRRAALVSSRKMSAAKGETPR